MPHIEDSEVACLTPTQVEIAGATAALGLIGNSAGADSSIEFRTKGGQHSPDICVPKAVNSLILAILKEMAQGRTVHVVSEERDLSTQEAADILRVSRPYLVRLLDEGRIPFYWVGSHRRVLYQDIRTYRAERWSSRKAALDRLSELDQELGLNE